MAVRITQQALDELAELREPIISRLNRIIERLEAWPNVSGAKPLKHDLAGRFRMRTGDYRLQFYVTGDDVVIERIGHRDGFYDE